MRSRIVTAFLIVAVLVLAASLAMRQDIGRPRVGMQEHAFDVPDLLMATSLQVPLVAVSTTVPEVSTSTSHAPNTIWRARFLHEAEVKPGERSVRVPVLMYHQVRPQKPDADRVNRLMTVSPESFAEQMQALVDGGYATITPDDLRAALDGGHLPAKPVLITFDDGYRNQYDHAYPVLKRLGLKATFFIVSGYVGRPAYMSKAELSDMLGAGIATIGSHTVSHRGLVDAPPIARTHEIVDAKKALEAMFHVPVMTFAYPYGNHNDEVMKEVAAAGYTSAYSTFLGATQTSSTRFELRRIRVNDGESMAALLEYFAK